LNEFLNTQALPLLVIQQSRVRDVRPSGRCL
jgi:hypothetical protein